MKKRLGIGGIVFAVITLAAFGFALLFQSRDRLRDNAVRLVNVRGGADADSYTFVSYYRWISDETLLLFQFAYQNKPMRLVRWDKTTKRRTVIEVPEITHRWREETSHAVAVSPDGSRLLVPTPDPIQSGIPARVYPPPPVEYSPILFPLTPGGKTVVLPKTTGSVAWTPNGELVALRRDTAQRMSPRILSRRGGMYAPADRYLATFYDGSDLRGTRVVPLNLAPSGSSAFYIFHESRMQVLAAGKDHLLVSGLSDGTMGSGRSSARLIRVPLNGGACTSLYRAAPGTSQPLELVAVSKDAAHLLWREDAAQRMRLRPKTASVWDTVRDTVEGWYYTITHQTKPGATPFALWDTDGAGMGIRLVAEYVEDGHTKDTRASQFQYLPSSTHFSFRQDGAIWIRPAR